MNVLSAGNYLELVALGIGVGCYGTLIGAGGGFVLMPVLLQLYPHQTASLLTCISLAVGFFNALSGSDVLLTFQQEKRTALAMIRIGIATLIAQISILSFIISGWRSCIW